MSIDSKYNVMKEFNKRLTEFKAIKKKKRETQLNKEQIMKNADGLDEKYYNACKSE